ncbi:MAG TPA: sigma-70 family RNA polymerase sigma factor [Gaiellales bacterium]
MEPARESAAASAPLDPDSRAWVRGLSRPSGERDMDVARLHAFLLRAARFELVRRRAALRDVPAGELDDMALQAADDALLAVMRKLPTFRGDSRFTTWAAKFAILEASVKARRRAWQHREITLDPEAWTRLAPAVAAADADEAERLRAIATAIRDVLSPHQREILVAIALNDVPIDVLADRLQTTRGAIYKTLHDARRNLRAHLAREVEP